MRCTECKDYAECHKKYDLRRKRLTCKLAKDIYVRSNYDYIRSLTVEGMADFMSEHSIEGFCCLVCDGICKAYATLEKSAGEACREIIAEWLKQPYKEENE